MANNLIPEELNALIQQYLTDGVLTDKERQVILNKAEKMGLDRDEVDLYLDAEEQKIDQATDAAVRKQKGKVCPFCNGSIPLLTDKCPHCDATITPEASNELQEILNNLEEALVDLKTVKDVNKSKAIIERYFRKAKTYYGNNPKVQKLLAEIEIEKNNAEKYVKRKKTTDTVKNICKHVWEKMCKHPFISFFIILILVLGTADACFSSHSSGGPSRYELFNNQIDSLIKEDRLTEITQLLQENPIPNDYDAYKDYDPVYLKVINAYLEKGDLKSAGNIGALLKAQISDYEWTKSSCYKILKFNYNKEGEDFSHFEPAK